MMRPAPEVTVYLCVAPVDMRKQATSLALLVEQSLGHNVFDVLNRRALPLGQFLPSRARLIPVVP